MRNDPTVQLQAFDPNSPNRAYKLRPGYSPGSCTKNKTNPVITDLEASPDEPNRNVSKEPRTIRSSNEPSYYSILRALEEKGPENKADNYPMISLDYYEDIIEASIDHFETIHPKTREESIKILSHVCKDIPEIVKKVTMLSEDETPKLEKSFYVLKRSQVQWEDLQGVDVEYVPAVAIVVGNIPMSCGVEIFLRMFEEYQPIVASKVKTTAEGLRYCWIHFREVCDCAAVEQRYDGVEVDGNFLVVQGAKMLKEE
ncbi:uncharacterized protein LOC107038082 [Diachasma alloeum]|uniref:uncharacterized protein LOC107038082 n=1 Tax=Diachasma alloeum TaxID=454923 RepID=UPI00073823D5|nr:uncharacterized protein LOC107038082 [Diachasma alloeum]